ncbi:MAG TPA: hypothetical protein VJ023_12020, partial [Pyrinomonadaceae bacterium]|nr:hypothetical protein [Pyrinomonadaceae bacterium]
FVDPSGLDGECVDVDGNIVDCGPDVIDDKVVTNIWDWWGPLWDLYWGRRDYIPLILPVLNDGSRPVVELIPIPHDPGDLDSVNRGFAACGTGASIGLYSNQIGDRWVGWYQNGPRTHAMSYPGNQHALRSAALNNASAFRALGKVSLGVGTGIGLYQGVGSFRRGDYAGAGKSGLDIGMGAIGTLGGPPGAVIAGGYFAVDLTIGWDGVAKIEQNSHSTQRFANGQGLCITPSMVK